MHHNNNLIVNRTCCKCHYSSVLCKCGSLGVQGTDFFIVYSKVMDIWCQMPCFEELEVSGKLWILEV